MPTWEDVPDEIKKRFRAPPSREKFSTEAEYEEALGYWQSRVGRNLGMVMQQYNASLSKYLMHARMLVPKFACQDDSGFHIQWPKDDSKVVYANTMEELVEELAVRLRALGRVGNEGPHVPPENGCPTC